MKQLILCLSLITIVLCSGVLALGSAPKTEEGRELAAALKSGLPVVVKVGADWCPPCRQMKPIISELAREEKGKIIFLDLEIDKHESLAKENRINLIPTTLFYDKNGELKGKQTGFMGRDDLLRKIKELKLTGNGTS